MGDYVLPRILELAWPWSEGGTSNNVSFRHGFRCKLSILFHDN